MSSVDLAIDVLLGESSGINYFDIGHSIGSIMWGIGHDGKFYETEPKGSAGVGDDEFSHPVLFSKSMVIKGRVDPSKKIGTIFIVHDVSRRVKLKAMDTVVDKYPGIKFYVFDWDDISSQGKSLSDYYQSLGV